MACNNRLNGCVCADLSNKILISIPRRDVNRARVAREIINALKERFDGARQW